MKHLVWILSGCVSLLPLSMVQAGEMADTKVSCADLGYDTDYVLCAMQSMSVPLLCPMSGASGNLKAMCFVSACRGYPLTEEDLQGKAADGSSLLSHIKGEVRFNVVDGGGISGCKAGYEQDGDGLKEIWRYRINQCAEGSAFQNNLCDVGCDRTAKYPYNDHPGNLAGTVQNCIDDKGECFGYVSCRDGWTLSNGRCELNSCSISEYPFLRHPDKLVEGSRGTVVSCNIGANPYYKYISCNKGYTLKGAMCVGNCEIDAGSCHYTTEPNGVKRWSCNLKNASTCAVGDDAVVGGKTLGIIIHLPDDTVNKTLIMATEDTSVWQKYSYYSWATGICTTSLSIEGSDSYTNYNGKVDTGYVKAYADEVTASVCTFPAARACYNYKPSTCVYDFCDVGEWYLPEGYELYDFIYKNQYLLASVSGDKRLIANERFWCSYWGCRELNMYNGMWYSYGRQQVRLVRPILEI